MASKFVRPRHKDEVLGAATESVRRARTAAAKDFTTMRENFVNTRTWRYYQEAERGADEPVVVSTPCDGAVVDAGERREVTRSGLTPANSGSKKPVATDPWELGLSFVFESTLDLETLRRSLRYIEAGKRFLLSLGDRDASHCPEEPALSEVADKEDIDSIFSKLEEVRRRTPPASAHAVDCSPLQDVLLEEVTGRALFCDVSSNDGIFRSEVPGPVGKVRITLIFDPSFASAIRVWVDGVPVCAKSPSVLDLGSAGSDSEFTIEIEYPESDSTLVSDQYLLRVTRLVGEHEAARASPEKEHRQTSISRPRSPLTRIASSREPSLGAGVEDESLRQLERQLERLERHLELGPASVGTAGSAMRRGVLAKVQVEDREDASGTRRTLTPKSPLATQVFSSSSSDEETSSRGSRESVAEAQGYASPAGSVETNYSSLEEAHRNIHNIKLGLRARIAGRQGRDRVSVATERILRMERAMKKRTEDVRGEIDSFRTELGERDTRAREEAAQRQRDLEARTDRGIAEVRGDLERFSEGVRGSIAKERELIQRTTVDLERRLSDKVGGLVALLESVQRTALESSNRVDQRLKMGEERFEQIRWDVSRLDGRLTEMKAKEDEFRASVLEDISALEQLMHRQR